MLPATAFSCLFVPLHTNAALSALGRWALLHCLRSNGVYWMSVHVAGFCRLNGRCSDIARFSNRAPRRRWCPFLQRVSSGVPEYPNILSSQPWPQPT